MKIKTIITEKNSSIPNIKELLQFKDLFMLLAYRDFKVRYAQTFLGFFWALIQPLMSILILIVVFGEIANVKTEVAFPVYVASGMAMWSYFSYVLSQSGSSLIASQQMLKKIYFPRLIIPLSKSIVGFIDFFIAFAILIGLFIYYQVDVSSNIVYVPLILFFSILASLGVGIWFSALTIRFRDFQHVLPFVVQVGLYATPIAYPGQKVIDSLPEWLSYLYFINPMAGIIEVFRWSIFGSAVDPLYVSISASVALILFITSLFYFRKMEYIIADLI